MVLGALLLTGRVLQDLMVDPVIDATSGISYERVDIEEWWVDHSMRPRVIYFHIVVSSSRSPNLIDRVAIPFTFIR